MPDPRPTPEMPEDTTAATGGLGPPSERAGLAVGASLVTGSQAIVALLGGVTGIIVARLLGPEGTGAFNLMLSTVLLIGAFATLGIEIGISYHVAGKRWRPEDALRQSQFAAAVLGALGIVVTAGIYAVAGGDAFAGVATGTLLIALAGVPFLLSWRYVTLLAVSVERYWTYAAATASQGLGMLVIVAGLTPWLHLNGALIGLSGSQLITAVGLLVWGRRTLPRPQAGWVRRSRWELGRASSFGIKAYLTNAMSFLNQRGELYVLSASATSATLGAYSVALTVTSLGLLLPRGLSNVLLPRVSALEADEGGSSETVASSVRHSVVVVALSTVVLAVGVLAIPMLYGPGFERSVGLSYILIPGISALGLANVLGATVTGKGHPEYSLYAALLVTPPSLTLYVVLIPVLGASGAAMLSTLSYLASSALTLFYFRRVAPEIPLRSLLPGRQEAHDYRSLVRGLMARRSR